MKSSQITMALFTTSMASSIAMVPQEDNQELGITDVLPEFEERQQKDSALSFAAELFKIAQAGYSHQKIDTHKLIKDAYILLDLALSHVNPDHKESDINIPEQVTTLENHDQCMQQIKKHADCKDCHIYFICKKCRAAFNSGRDIRNHLKKEHGIITKFFSFYTKELLPPPQNNYND